MQKFQYFTHVQCHSDLEVIVMESFVTGRKGSQCGGGHRALITLWYETSWRWIQDIDDTLVWEYMEVDTGHWWHLGMKAHGDGHRAFITPWYRVHGGDTGHQWHLGMRVNGGKYRTLTALWYESTWDRGTRNKSRVFCVANYTMKIVL